MISSQKVAIVTGAAKRIGAAIARELHGVGMNVVLHYHVSEKEANELCKELNAIRVNSAVTVAGDLSAEHAEKIVIGKAIATWNRLDVLINNASKFFPTKFGNVTRKEWFDLMNSNLTGPFFLAQEASRYLAEHQGCIVNITDVNGDRGLLDYSVYCISKAALIATTRFLASEVGPLLRVNAVSPGPILWPEGEAAMSDAEKFAMLADTPLKSLGSPEQIAKAVLALIQSTYTTGQVLKVDGGKSDAASGVGATREPWCQRLFARREQAGSGDEFSMRAKY